MHRIIFCLALFSRQVVSSVPEKDVPSADTTNFLFNRATDPTYAIDKSCNSKPQVQGIVNDWLETAQETSRRMNLRNADPVFQYAFQIVFWTDVDNPKLYNFTRYWRQFQELSTAFTFVKWVTNYIGSLILHTNRITKANHIFYCDDDEMNATPYTTERWQVRPNIPDDPNPNSGRDIGVNQEWFDQINFIGRNPSTKGCKDKSSPDNQWMQMETYYQPIDPFQYGRRLPPVGLQPQRSTTTICDYVLAPDSDFFPTIASFLANTITVPDVESPQRLTYQPYEDILSAALYHETTHMAGLGLNDVKTPDGETAYGWTKIMQLGTKQRLMNADNYLFLGLLARYEKLGVCLHPDAAEAKAGTLVRAPAGWAAP